MYEQLAVYIVLICRLALKAPIDISVIGQYSMINSLFLILKVQCVAFYPVVNFCLPLPITLLNPKSLIRNWISYRVLVPRQRLLNQATSIVDVTLLPYKYQAVALFSTNKNTFIAGTFQSFCILLVLVILAQVSCDWQPHNFNLGLLIAWIVSTSKVCAGVEFRYHTSSHRS